MLPTRDYAKQSGGRRPVLSEGEGFESYIVHQKHMAILSILFGLVVVIVGALVTIKSDWFYKAFGPIPSAEKYLGTEGGSRLAYKLIGILICIIGFLIMTGLITGVLNAIASLFTPGIG